MANANICVFVYALMYVLGLTERCVMCRYVRSLRLRAKLTNTHTHTQRERERDKERERETHKERETERERWHKAQGIIPHLFQRGQLVKSKITACIVLFEYKLKI